MIVWGIIHKINKIEQTIQLHDVILVENIKVHLETVFSKIENALCTDMILNISNSNHAFISTTYGNILHISLATGTKLQPAKYTRGRYAYIIYSYLNYLKFKNLFQKHVYQVYYA